MANLVILVDDDSITNVLNETIIQKSGYPCDIVIVDDSREALLFLNSRRNNYDHTTVFLDYQMPNMNGMDILRHLDQSLFSTEKTTIYFLTSSDTDALFMQVNTTVRVKQILQKPLTPEMIKSILQVDPSNLIST